ncbi:MAG: SPW repeat protein [Rhodoblastus sp.]|nr:SPW repeat protein [Rhodoblastus sp.]
MSELDQAMRGLCASNRCLFIILALGLALVAAPGPMDYSSNSAAMTASIVSGLAVWVCALAALIGMKRLFLGLCALCGVLAAAAPWIFGFRNAPDAVLVHEAIGVAIALVALGGLAMSSVRANVPVRA